MYFVMDHLPFVYSFPGFLGRGHWLHLHHGTPLCLLQVSSILWGLSCAQLDFAFFRHVTPKFTSCSVWEACSCDDKATD